MSSSLSVEDGVSSSPATFSSLPYPLRHLHLRSSVALAQGRPAQREHSLPRIMEQTRRTFRSRCSRFSGDQASGFVEMIPPSDQQEDRVPHSYGYMERVAPAFSTARLTSVAHGITDFMNPFFRHRHTGSTPSGSSPASPHHLLPPDCTRTIDHRVCSRTIDRRLRSRTTDHCIRSHIVDHRVFSGFDHRSPRIDHSVRFI
jgi:hypothetical protein